MTTVSRPHGTLRLPGQVGPDGADQPVGRGRWHLVASPPALLAGSSGKEGAKGLNVERILRLQGAVRAAAASVSENNAVAGADPMLSSYRRLRDEVRGAIPSEDVPEFDRVCPPNVPAFAANRSRALDQAGKFHAARSMLEQMAGWLDGYVRHAQLQAEAEAYAAERVKEERGIGFRSNKGSLTVSP